MVNKKTKKNPENSEALIISLRDMPLDRRREEAGKPLFLIRYD